MKDQYVIVLLLLVVFSGCQNNTKEEFQQWISIEDHGSKPATALQLFVNNGNLDHGKFYILSPNEPITLQSEGQSAPISEITKISDLKYTYFVEWVSGSEREKVKIHLSLLKPFNGYVGDKILAKTKATDGKSQEITLVRKR